jgi:polyhydroxyalkanoate synthesis regulator phasin
MEWDFASNQEIDEATLGTAPEGYRGAYAKGDDGKYRIADGFKPFVDAISGLGTALKNERGVTKNLRGQKDISAVLKEGLGFETVEEAKARLDELTQQVTTASKVDPAKIKADIEKTFDGERQKLQGENKAMLSTLQRYMIQSAAVSALAAAKGNEKLLLPVIRDQVELVKDGDDYVVRVKDGAGDYRGNGKGGFMTVEDLVDELRKSQDYGVAFESETRHGTQRQEQRPGPQARQGMQRQGNEPVNANDRIARGLAARRGR